MGGAGLEASLTRIGIGDRQSAIDHQGCQRKNIAVPFTEPVVPDEEMTAESFDPLMVIVTVAEVPSVDLTVKVSVSVSPLPSA